MLLELNVVAAMPVRLSILSVVMVSAMLLGLNVVAAMPVILIKCVAKERAGVHVVKDIVVLLVPHVVMVLLVVLPEKPVAMVGATLLGLNVVAAMPVILIKRVAKERAGVRVVKDIVVVLVPLVVMGLLVVVLEKPVVMVDATLRGRTVVAAMPVTLIKRVVIQVVVCSDNHCCDPTHPVCHNDYSIGKYQYYAILRDLPVRTGLLREVKGVITAFIARLDRVPIINIIWLM